MHPQVVELWVKLALSMTQQSYRLWREKSDKMGRRSKGEIDNVNILTLHAVTEMNFLPSPRVGIEPDISDLEKKERKRCNCANI